MICGGRKRGVEWGGKRVQPAVSFPDYLGTTLHWRVLNPNVGERFSRIQRRPDPSPFRWRRAQGCGEIGCVRASQSPICWTPMSCPALPCPASRGKERGSLNFLSSAGAVCRDFVQRMIGCTWCTWCTKARSHHARMEQGLRRSHAHAWRGPRRGRTGSGGARDGCAFALVSVAHRVAMTG